MRVAQWFAKLSANARWWRPRSAGDGRAKPQLRRHRHEDGNGRGRHLSKSGANSDTFNPTRPQTKTICVKTTILKGKVPFVPILTRVQSKVPEKQLRFGDKNIKLEKNAAFVPQASRAKGNDSSKLNRGRGGGGSSQDFFTNVMWTNGIDGLLAEIEQQNKTKKLPLPSTGWSRFKRR